ncbi:MAG: hypothetical protein CMO44_19250 [Verrucomicrobiales bacterium]|nr:hypothetical protein [Verrucomicrobiales bacterium]
MAEFRIGRLKFNWRGVWTPSTAYVIDDIIKFGANTYVCTENHTSTSSEVTFYSLDLANGRWSLHTEGLSLKGDWVSSTFYKVNDIFKYGNTQYRVKESYTSESTFSPTPGGNANILEEYLESFNFENTWDSATQYQEGDVVTYGGYTYVSKNINSNAAPATSAAQWDILTTGFNVVGTWNSGTSYIQGDVVKFGGSSYVAVVNNLNNSPSAGGSSVWKLVVDGIEWKGNWDYSTTYKKGEAVKRLSNSYISINGTNNLNQDPATDATGTFWNVLVEGAANNVMQSEGDLVYYTSGATRLPAGTDGQTLTISSGGVPQWDNNSVTNPVFYVTEEGRDDNDGSNISRAFATVKKACGIATGPATIYVKAGTYEEQLPIIIPEGITIVGDNLRTTKIRPTSGDSHFQEIELASTPSETYTVANASYNNTSGDMVLTIGAHSLHVNDSIKIADESIKFSCNFGGAVGATAEKSYPRPIIEGVTADYITGKNVKVTAVDATTITVNVNKKPGQAISITEAHTFVSATAGGITKSEFQISLGTIISNGAGTKTALVLNADYHEKNINIAPLTGGLWTTSDTWDQTATPITITSVVTRPNNESYMFLMSNKTMLKDILMDGLTGFQPAGQVAQISASISGTIVTGTGFFPDLVGTTVTGTGISAGTKVNNFISSTQIEVDIVQTVASTQLTFTATPGDPNNATIKGVYVSLNPASPIKKSPYVSNCSAQSIGGVGAMVDGQVHRQFADDGINPSNKSIVMDSFTQIHDGGMGFFITNAAASELVSSFTYYCHISYAATRGGRIRSLAGNSSWGNYGIVSSGYSNNEKALEGTVEGLKLQIDPSTIVPGTSVAFSLNERIKGADSQAEGYINSIQGTAASDMYYSLITAGPVSVGGTGFRAGEEIEGLTTGVKANLIAADAANRGQDGRTLVLAGLSTAVVENGSIQFLTGSGNGGLGNQTISGADPFTFVISGVSRIGADGRGSIVIDRSEWTTTGAAHTGGITNIIKYPNQTTSGATLLTPLYANETTINCSTITGFNPNEFVLIDQELCKISSFPTSNSITVTRASQGAGIASDYPTGQAIVSIGASSVVNNAETFKDFESSDISMRVFDASVFELDQYYKIEDEFVKVSGINTDTHGLTTLTLVEDKAAKCYDEQDINIRYIFSQARLTGHDFLQVGTGGTVTTNWPDVPEQDPVQSQEINESYPGRVFYVSTDHEGNFRVGRYFRVNQATGSATLNANAFDLSGLTNLQLGSIGAQLGASINEFSTDGTLSQNSPEKCPTQSAVKTYVDTNITNLTNDTNVGLTSVQTDALTQAFWLGLSA